MSIRDNLGGGSAAKINVLDTLEEIEANTDPGKPAGALAIKEISNNLGGLRFGSDGEGNVGYFGADGSLIPFKFNLENVNIEFKTVKHSDGNAVKYTTNNKIVCIFASPGATTAGVGRASVGDKNYIYNAYSGFSITEVTDYSYSIKNGAYSSYINIIILTEK